MAGHSKWSNIKHRKAAQDAKRGKIFTRLIRELTVSARISSDVDSNPRLRAAIDNALSNNMTRDTIDRAIKRAAGAADADNLLEMTYEGYGPAGVAVMVECMSDNKNRTVSEVRHAFTKHGGNLGSDGSVSYLFNKGGQIYVEGDEDKVIEVALDAGADDVSGDDGMFEIRTSTDTFAAVREALKEHKINIVDANVTMIPDTTVKLAGEQAELVQAMLDRLEELDDVQNVYSNLEFED